MRHITTTVFFLSGLIALCLVFNSVPGVSQPRQLKFDLLTSDDGLPDNQTRYVLQDRNGILWVGHAHGLSKYDGYEVTSFRPAFNDSLTIRGGLILTLFEDREGRLWVSSIGTGIDLSNREKDRFTHIPLWSDSIPNREISVFEITQDVKGKIWMATNEGVIVLEEKDGVFYRLELSELLAENAGCDFPPRPSQIMSEANGNIWIGSGRGLFVYNMLTRSLRCPDQLAGLPVSAVYDIQKDRKNNVWVSISHRRHRLYHLNADQSKFILFDKIPFDTNFIACQFAFDLDDQLWATVFSDQAYGYNFRDSVLFFTSSTNPGLEHERFFRAPYVDISGKVWIPCDGLLSYPYSKGFSSYRHPFPFLQNVTTYLITEDWMWIGIREKGILKINRKNHDIYHMHENAESDLFLPGALITAIVPLQEGGMMIVAFDRIIFLDNESKFSKSFEMAGANRDGFQDSKGRIWVGSVGGMHLFSAEKGMLKTYRLPSAMGDGRMFVQDFVEDPKGYIWFASGGRGLGRLDPDTENILHFHLRGTPPYDLISNGLNDMDIDQYGQLWIGSDHGLTRFNTSTFEKKNYSFRDGLEQDFVNSIICHPDGKIWIAGQNKISSLDPESDTFTHYSRSDGLLGSAYADRASFLFDDGTLYFGGKEGTDFFHPDQLRLNPAKPKMWLSGISIIRDGKPHAYQLDGNEVQLSYEDDLIEFKFSGIQFSEQHEVTYQYRLEPMHSDWIDLGREHKVLFSNLKPGNYIFRARAMSPDGIWSDATLDVPVCVAPPFFQTVWFRFLMMCLLISTVVAFIKYRESRIRAKEQQEADVTRQLMELEKRALQAQMNPHFIYNSMNSIQQFILLHDTEGAMKYLTRFSRILRTVLNMSSQSRIPLDDEIKLIEDYIELEKMRFPDKFTYNIDVAPELNIHSLEIPPFFIQPQVENAIRHGLLQKKSPGHLLVELKIEGEHLQIIVQDNGIGRDASRAGKMKEVSQHESKGLSIIEERLRHLHVPNGHHPFRIIDLYDKNHNPQGTRVEILLPMD